MVSTRPPNSKSSRPFNNPLVTVPKTPITNGSAYANYYVMDPNNSLKTLAIEDVKIFCRRRDVEEEDFVSVRNSSTPSRPDTKWFLTLTSER